MSAPSPGTIRIKEIAATPAAPPVGYASLYVKTDNVVYLIDSNGIEVPLGTASGITSLTGEATAAGPGAAVITLSNSAVISKVLTGFTPGPNSIVLSTDTILAAFEKLQAQISASSGIAITSLTGDVSAAGPGAAAATVNSVGSKPAAQISTSVDDTLTATASNTASKLVKRDASGNFSANTITANLTGNATTATTSGSFSGSLSGDVTGTQGATVVSTVGGKSASSVSTSVNDTQAATTLNTASTIVKRDAFGNFVANTITANLTGTASGNELPIIATTAADYYRGDKTFHTLNKAAVGLSNVDNTSDVNKPVSTAQAAADAAVQAFSIQRANHTGTQLSTTISDFNEAAQDAVGNILTDTAQINFTYNDTLNTIDATINPNSVTDTELSTGINANKIGTGIVSNTEYGYLDGATSNIQAQINSVTGSGITSLTGDVTATGPGAAAATVATVGGSSASNINLATIAANAATNLNTPSTIVKRDASGNFNASNITSNLTGVASGNELPIVATTAADYYRGDKTFHTLNKAAVGLANVDNTSDVNKPVSTAQAAADAAVQAFSIQRSNHTGTQLSGTISDFNEAAQDAVGNILTNTTTINSTYNDVSNTISSFVNALSITNAELAAGLNAAKISSGIVSNTEFDYLDGLTSNIQAQINSVTGSGITSLTGDVTATGPGASAATVVSVGTSSAANVHTAELAANAATNVNTPSTIVKRNASGDILVSHVNGIVPEAHAARHLPSGADPLTTAIAITLDSTTADAIGTANSLARSDHSHAITTAVPVTQSPNQTNALGSAAGLAKADHIHNIPTAAPIMQNADQVNADGVATSFSKSDHIHNIPTDVPVQIGTSNSQGASVKFAKADHIHNHGNQSNPALHAAATTLANGFQSAADKIKSDAQLPATLGTSNQVLGVNNAGTAGEYKSIIGTVNQVIITDTVGVKTFTLPQDIATSSTPTFAGENLTNRLELTEQAAPVTPAATKLDIFVESSNGFSRIRSIDSTGYTSTVSRDIIFLVKNTTGATITKGSSVYVNGSDSTNGVVSIALARANSSTTAPVFGLTIENIANGAFGRVLTIGILSGIDTSAFVDGQRVYLSATVAGGLTATKPISPNIWQRIGVVIKSNLTTGSIEVRPLSTHGEESGTNTGFSLNTVALTDAATINTDASLGNVFTVTLAGNRILAAPTNPTDGQKITFRFTQDATGSRTITFDPVFRFGLDIISVILSTVAGKTDYVGCQYNATSAKWDVLAISKAF